LITPTATAFPWFYPYTVPSLPGPRLENSPRLQNLIVDGKLALSLDDAVALALENNLEIAVTRYDLPLPKRTSCARREAARHVAWRAPINRHPFLRQSGRGVGSAGGVGPVAREASWEAVSTALVHHLL